MATKAIVGEKVGMTQIWDSQARLVPVTVVKIDPCRIVQVKTPESDGYSALQVTFGSREARKLTKPEAGHFAKAGVAPGLQGVSDGRGRGRRGDGCVARAVVLLVCLDKVLVIFVYVLIVLFIF